MPEAGTQERGYLYPAEKPTYNKGQEGEGARVSGSVQGVAGENISTGGDNYAAKLRKGWSSSMSFGGRFGRPK